MIDGEFIKDFFQILVGISGCFLVAHKLWGAVGAIKQIDKNFQNLKKELNDKLLAEKQEHEREFAALWNKYQILENRIYEQKK